MATGYTACVVDGKVEDFKTFLWRCARAMMPLVMMRDDPMDAPVPEAFEASPVYAEKLTAAIAEVDLLRFMDQAQREAFGIQKQNEELEYLAEARQETIQARTRLDAMLSKVTAWVPPTSEHIPLKDFMLQQLGETIEYDGSTKYHDDRAAEIAKTLSIQYHANALERAIRNVAYYTEEARKEQERAALRTTWVKVLRESL